MDKNSRKNKIIRILEIIGKGVKTTAEIFNELFPSQYESYREMMGLAVRDRRFKSKADWQEYKRNLIKDEELQRFYNMLSKLKREGFIEKLRRGIWSLTAKGESKKNKFFERIASILPKGKYPKEKLNEFKIIVFDIPEREKQKRDWLRAVLRRLGFKMLQKSVWLGKIKLPEEFINDLRELGLLDFVEILAITRTGSLRHLE